MSTIIYKGGGGVKNGQNLVYVVKVWPQIKNNVEKRETHVENNYHLFYY